MESYSFVTRDGVFANAQTGNIARLGMSLAQGDFGMALRYLIPVVVFVLGVTVSMQMKKVFDGKKKKPLSFCQVEVLTEMVLLFLVGLIPPGKYDVAATALISFVCAIQVESFRHFGGNAFASTMCTGNLRSATEKLNAFLSTGDKGELHTSLRYYGIDGVFALAVAIGYWATARFCGKAVWLCLLVLAVLFVLFTAEHVRERITEKSGKL